MVLQIYSVSIWLGVVVLRVVSNIISFASFPFSVFVGYSL